MNEVSRLDPCRQSSHKPQPVLCHRQVIVDTQAWVANMPHTILAVFVKVDEETPNPATWDSREELDEATIRKRGFLKKKYLAALKFSTDVHAAFLREYGISSEQVPLLEYNPVRWRQAVGDRDLPDDVPFKDISPQASLSASARR